MAVHDANLHAIRDAMYVLTTCKKIHILYHPGQKSQTDNPVTVFWSPASTLHNHEFQAVFDTKWTSL